MYCVPYCTVLYCTVLYLVESIDSAPPLVELGEDHPVEAEHHSDGQENGDGGGQLHLLQQQTVKKYMNCKNNISGAK